MAVDLPAVGRPVAAARRRLRPTRGRRPRLRQRPVPGRSRGAQPDRRRAREGVRPRAGTGAGQCHRRPRRRPAARRARRTGQGQVLRGRLRLPPGRRRVRERRAQLPDHPGGALRPRWRGRPGADAGPAKLAHAAAQAGAVAGDQRWQRAAPGRTGPGQRRARGAGPGQGARLCPGPAGRQCRGTGGGGRDLAWRHRRGGPAVAALQPTHAVGRQAPARHRGLGGGLDLRGQGQGAGQVADHPPGCAQGDGVRCRWRRRRPVQALRQGRQRRPAGSLPGAHPGRGRCRRLPAR